MGKPSPVTRKASRPSHICHSYFLANLRLSLGENILPGKEHA